MAWEQDAFNDKGDRLMSRETIGDKVILSLSSDEIEQELANIEDLEVILLSKLTDEQDRNGLKQTFDVAKTAMQMVWLATDPETDEVEKADMERLRKATNSAWARKRGLES